MSLLLPALKVVSCLQKQPCLLDYANQSRDQGRFNDVTVVAGDTRVPANRMVLSCYCSYFDQIFSSSTNDLLSESDFDSSSDVKSERTEQLDNDSVVDIPDVNGNSLELIIQYIYTGQICIDSDNVFGILAAADHLELDELKQFCFEFLQSGITVDNCITVLITAKQYQNLTLRDEVYKFIGENYEPITRTEAFRFLSYNELFFCIFHLKQKFHVIDAVLCLMFFTWVKHNIEERKKHLPKLEQFVNDKDCYHKTLQEVLSSDSEQSQNDLLSLLDLGPDTMTVETKILSVGGHASGKKVIEVYSAGSDANVVYPDLPVSLYDHCLLKLDNFVYCIGGTDSDHPAKHSNKVFRMKLNQTNLKWEEVASMHEYKCRIAASVLNRKLVVCGGWNGEKVLSSTEVYDPELDKWIVGSPLINGRISHQVVNYNRTLLSLGGKTLRTTIRTVEQLDDEQGPWRYFSSMQTPRQQFAAVRCDECVFAIGGRDMHNKVLKSVEKYIFSANKWVYAGNLTVGRYVHSACVMHGEIFVIGGKDSRHDVAREIESYNPSKNKWQIIEITKDELFGHSLVVV